VDPRPRPPLARHQGRWWLTFLKNLVPSFFETVFELDPDYQIRQRRMEDAGLPVDRIRTFGQLAVAVLVVAEGVRRLVVGEPGTALGCLALAVVLALTARWSPGR
jgi:hypothetical protein